jgi:hypothetical protein
MTFSDPIHTPQQPGEAVTLSFEETFKLRNAALTHARLMGPDADGIVAAARKFENYILGVDDGDDA